MKLNKSTLNKLIKEELEEMHVEEDDIPMHESSQEVARILQVATKPLGTNMAAALAKVGLKITNWRKLAAAMAKSGGLSRHSGYYPKGEKASGSTGFTGPLLKRPDIKE